VTPPVPSPGPSERRGTGRTRALPALLAAGLTLTIAAAAPPYRDGAPAAHTGGFDEAHCGACHFVPGPGHELGHADLDAPRIYLPGATYDLVVAVRHPELGAGGFQLTARFADDHRAGQQAGRLEARDERTHVTISSDHVAYAGHTLAGSATDEAGSAQWTVRWIAPHERGTVVFHLAANAADDDDSEFGDHIYVARKTARPAPAGSAAGPRQPARR
jgi:hypothetical protein